MPVVTALPVLMETDAPFSVLVFTWYSLTDAPAIGCCPPCARPWMLTVTICSAFCVTDSVAQPVMPRSAAAASVRRRNRQECIERGTQ